MQVSFFVVCMLLIGYHETIHAQEQVHLTTHDTPSSGNAEQTLVKKLLQTIGLSARTSASTLTAEQQDDLFCAILDVIMNPDDRTTYATIQSAFQTYCSSFQQLYPNVYQNFTKPKIKGFCQVVTLLQAYNSLSDDEIPPHAREKRKRDRIAFDKKWNKLSAIIGITKKFK